MISSNTRASRSASRSSSPAQPGWGSSAGNEGSRALMARWLEPSVQSKTSFEEAGLMRYGVLENMAPLGTMPKSKKTAPADGTAVRKIILRPSGKPTPQVSPAPPSPQPVEQQAKAKVDQGREPDTTRRRRSTRASLPSRKLRRAQETPEASVIMAKTPSPGKKQRLEPEEREFTDKVVEAAVDEALRHYRYPTAWALRTLYDERCEDADFVAMVDDVFRQTADAETRNRFGRLVEAKKREGKRDNQGCYYFVPPTTNSRFSPHKAKPAPYASLLQRRLADHDGEGEDDGDEETDQTEERAAKRPKTSSTGAVVMVRTPRSSKVGRRDSASSMSSLSSAMSLSSPGETGVSPIEEEDEEDEGVDEAPAQDQTVKEDEVEEKEEDEKEEEEEEEEEKKKEPEPKRHQPPRQGSESNSPTLVRRTRTRRAPPMADEEEKEARSTSPDDAFARRRHARRVTNGHGARESAVRAVLATPPRLASASASASASTSTPASAPVSSTFAAAAAAASNPASASAAASASRRPRRIVVAPPTTRATRSANKRRPSVESPAAFSWQIDDYDDNNNNNDDDDATTAAAVAADGSRAATPRPAKKQRTGLRVKTSPVKKKGGTAAGVPRPVAESAGANSKDHTSDNDEYCSACGNAGDVVCCDGCPRSFHFECVDMVQSDRLPDEWYCNECLIRRFPSRVPVHRGIFASALNNLEKCIPRAFSLPVKVQNRFEGVKAGADGDYEEVVLTKATTKKRPGYDELPDFFKQRDDGRAVLCHACQKPATAGIRAIITCSACPFHWHLDCLDPPLAVPPVLKTWRCPAHLDDVLLEVPSLAPAHRFRRIKGSQPLTPALARGLKNNGHIEIDWSDEVDRSGWPDASSFGRTYKLASNGVVLDFIEHWIRLTTVNRLRHQGAGYGPRRHESRRIPCMLSSQPVHDGPLVGSTLERSVEEMQLSLTLTSLREKPTEGIEQLICALLSVADDNVLALMAKTNAATLSKGPLSPSDRRGLGALLAQMEAMSTRIRSMLDEKPSPSSSSSPSAATAPTGAGVVHTAQPLAEPTPPSTVDHAEGSSMDLE
ncbi:hypothetical protein CP533_4409 [Ophiocordyceps camponoti-saundersi (nom. inval.)]|nr:hypothetical protein CP533_4409 [Ophiocordyceps camponoti-saundersi (nom. inval.)]